MQIEFFLEMLGKVRELLKKRRTRMEDKLYAGILMIKKTASVISDQNY